MIRILFSLWIDELAPILSNPKVMEYSVDGLFPQGESRHNLQTRILEQYQNYGYGLCVIVSKETKEIIGLAAPLQQEVDEKKCIEIVYRIAPSKWGKDVIPEVIEAIQAAMIASDKHLSPQVIYRKRIWSDKEVYRAMEANMFLI